MIFANVAIANFVKETDLQMIYRHHPEPESDKLFHLKEEAEKLNLKTNMDDNSISKLCNMILENTSKNEKKALLFLDYKKSTKFGILFCLSVKPLWFSPQFIYSLYVSN